VILVEPKTWEEVKQYIKEVQDDLGDEDWGEIRYIIKKMSPEERAKMLNETAKYAQKDSTIAELREKQIGGLELYEDESFMEALKQKQREDRGI